MNVENFLTHVDNEQDLPFLRNPLFDVNMRLFNDKANPVYKQIVTSCCNYLSEIALTEMDGYKLPHGCSGANIAIPFNIIAIVKNRGTVNAYTQVMINPKVVNTSGDPVESESNCGSIRLPAPIIVMRDPEITVEYYDLTGKKVIELFDHSMGGFTIQHEIDHNLGILITDIEVKKAK